MNTRVLFTAAALLAVLAGCQSGPWKTALGSKFRDDKSSRGQGNDTADDVRLVSDDNRSRSGGFRRQGSDGNESGQDSGDLRDVLRRGHRAEKDGRIKQAKMFYRQAIDIDPRNSLAHHRLAIIADSERDFRTAEEHYLTALSIKQNDPNLLSDLGYSFLLQNRPDESKYYLEQALKTDPSHMRALNNLGLLHAKQGDYDRALAMFRQTGSERDVQAKMTELFPNGRPGGISEAPSRNSSLAGNAQQPFRTHVTQASVPAPWENGGTGDRVQTADGFSGRSTTFDDRNEFQRNPGARPFPAEGNAVSSDSINGFGGGFNENSSRLTNRENENPADLKRANPFTSEATRTTGQQLDSRQLPPNPLDALEEWPPSRQSQPAPPRGQAVPFPPATKLPENSFGPSSQNSTNPFSDGQRTIQVAGDQLFDPHAVHNANVRSKSAAETIDRRQQAALMGMNAGPGGVFPVTHDDSRAIRQPAYPPARRPQDALPEFNSDPISTTNAADLRREFSAATAGQLQQGITGRRDQSLPPTNFGDERYRTAARPVSHQQEKYDPSNGNTSVQRDDRANDQQPTNHQFRQLLQQRSYQQPNSLPTKNSAYSQPGRTQYPPTESGSHRHIPQSIDRNRTQPDSTFNPGNSFQQGSSSR